MEAGRDQLLADFLTSQPASAGKAAQIPMAEISKAVPARAEKAVHSPIADFWKTPPANAEKAAHTLTVEVSKTPPVPAARRAAFSAQPDNAEKAGTPAVSTSLTQHDGSEAADLLAATSLPPGVADR
mmetsp:Transcript_41167/g.89938  ORF Transcript_41167/g.89938 Transcript_41167/m.89938 type:complete len:127 (+) Transcript_41167:720-1100(+)